MIRLFTIVAIGLLVLSFFGISIRSILQSPTGKDNITFIWDLVTTGWHILEGWVYLITSSITQSIR